MSVVLLIVALSVALHGTLARADEAPPPQLSKPPRLVHFVEAQSPPALALRGEVSVILNIDVDEKGKVTAVSVQTPAGDGFDEAATAAAQKFEFEPGEFEGKPVPVRITYRYRFEMRPQTAQSGAGAATPNAQGGTPVALPASGAGATTGAAAATVTAPAGPVVPLTGHVYRKGDRVPLGGVVVILDDGKQETVSDALGAFQFDAVALGDHVLRLRGGDIFPSDTKVKANPGKRLDLSMFVLAKERYMSTVRGEKVVVQAVEITIEQEEIRRLPGTAGDLLKVVQNLPGVARSPGLGGLLIVWGSPPQDTRVYVDGVYIPQLYHFGGLRSTVNSEMVQSLSFIPGAYGAERGLGLGGLVEVTTRTPRSDGYHGFVQADLIDGSLMLEGPIGKKVSFAAAVRRSWIQLFLPLLTPSSNFQITPVYYDYQARLSIKPTASDELSLFFFGSDDQTSIGAGNDNGTLTRQFGSHTFYHRGIISYTHRFKSGATWQTTASVGYDVPYQVQTVFNNMVSQNDDGHILSYTLRSVFRIPIARFLRLDGGIDYEGNLFTLDQTAAAMLIAGGGGLGLGDFGFGGGFPAGGGSGFGGGRGFGMFGGGRGPSNQELYTNHIAPLVSAQFSFFDNRLLIIPQFRLQVFTFLGYPGTDQQFSSYFIAPDPRVLVRAAVRPWLTLKAGFGMYHQAPLPQQLSLVNGNPDLQPQWGLHYVAGAEFTPMSRLHINIEGFYKDLRNLVVRGENQGDAIFVNDGIGRVYGGQMMVRLELWRNLMGWISYTASRSERKDHEGQDWHLFQYDQTHIFTVLASYKLPKGFQVGARFRYVTGNPYTAVADSYFDSNRSVFVPIAGPFLGSRIPAFTQLDVRIDKTFTFNRWRLSLYLDLQNTYNAKNAEAIVYNFNYTQTNSINSLPILPVFGVRGDF